MALPVGLSREARTTLLVVVALVLSFVTLPGFARFTHGASRDVDLSRRDAAATKRGIVVVFVDSLPEATARDAAVMPTLVSLARESASYAVSPCRDQLTYLCLRAAFTGKDESELFALGDNFRHDASAADTTSVFAAARAQGRQVRLVGAADLAPYGGGTTETRFFGAADEEEEAWGVRWLAETHRPGDVTVIGFGSGDRAAHAAGAGAPATREAFARIDVAIGKIAALVGDDTLVVLGDHGHDAHGHHLPGTPNATFALYRGPDFAPGSRGTLALTDHRALLGLSLGVPTPAVLGADAAHAPTLSPETHRELGPRLEALRTTPEDGGAPSGFGPRGALLLGLFGAIALFGLARGLVGKLAPVWIALALSAGDAYDLVRRHVHDHGYTPTRALWLLVPVALALWLARTTRGPHFLAPTEPLRTATLGVAVALLGLFPTAYFYGSLRASILAGAVAAGVLALHHLRRRRVIEAVAAAVLGAAIASLYAIHGEDEGSRYVMTNAAFHPLLAAVLPKLALAAFVARLVRQRRVVPVCALASLFVVQTLLYASSPRERAALELLEAIAALGLALLERHFPHRPARSLLVACVVSWLLVPVIGLRLAGIDFGFTFQIVPIARYEELWGLVAALTILKLSLPFALLAAIALARADGSEIALGAARLLAVRSVLLLVFVASYRATRPAGSRVVLEMLSEGVLLAFAIAATTFVPLVVSVAEWLRGRLGAREITA